METNENLSAEQAVAAAEMAEQNTAATEAEKAVESGDNSQAENGTHQEHIKEALELLYQHFPKAFIKEGDCKPLKVGILEDLKPLIAGIEGLSISKVRAAVRVYTTRLRYFYAVREGAMRVDLNGNEVEPVTAEHAEYARSRFSEINAKRRPAKPKKPNFRSRGKRPFNRDGQAQGAAGGEQRPGRFNRTQSNGQNGGTRRPERPQRRYEPAKESDIKAGRYVFVSFDRSYARGTVAEDLNGDRIKVTMQNGMPVTMPLNRIFVSAPNPNRPKRPFNNNGRSGFNRHGRGDNRPAGDSQNRGHGSNRGHGNGGHPDTAHGDGSAPAAQ